jgi:diguanylate cyclase (GGDEF)-like protein
MKDSAFVTIQVLRLLIAPFALMLMATLVLFSNLSRLSPELQLLIVALPYLLGAANLLLGFLFNQSRLLLATFNLLCVYALIQLCLQTPLERPDNYVLFSLLSLLMPINQLVICLAPERGLLNRGAWLRLLLPLITYLALWFLWQQQILGYWLGHLPMLLLELLVAGHYLSEGAAWLFGLTFVLCGLVLSLRRTRADAALFVSLLTMPALFFWFDLTHISPLLFTCIQLMLCQALISHSHQLAFIDELTDLPARRALQEQLSSLGQRYTLAMMDIDHFKQFNDRHGHDAGDQVLRMVASQLKQVGGGGRVFRYGGEEFTVLFRGKAETEALPHLEQLREAIASYPLHLRQTNRSGNTKEGRQQRRASKPANGPAKGSDKPLQVTISIGLCERGPSQLHSDEVMQLADKALYAAKRAGRNRTMANSQLTRRPRRSSQADFA